MKTCSSLLLPEASLPNCLTDLYQLLIWSAPHPTRKNQWWAHEIILVSPEPSLLIDSVMKTFPGLWLLAHLTLFSLSLSDLIHTLAFNATYMMTTPTCMPPVQLCLLEPMYPTTYLSPPSGCWHHNLNVLKMNSSAAFLTGSSLRVPSQRMTASATWILKISGREVSSSF